MVEKCSFVIYLASFTADNGDGLAISMVLEKKLPNPPPKNVASMPYGSTPFIPCKKSIMGMMFRIIVRLIRNMGLRLFRSLLEERMHYR